MRTCYLQALASTETPSGECPIRYALAGLRLEELDSVKHAPLGCTATSVPSNTQRCASYLRDNSHLLSFNVRESFCLLYVHHAASC